MSEKPETIYTYAVGGYYTGKDGMLHKFSMKILARDSLHAQQIAGCRLHTKMGKSSYKKCTRWDRIECAMNTYMITLYRQHIATVKSPLSTAERVYGRLVKECGYNMNIHVEKVTP